MNQVVVLFPGNERGGAATHIIAYAKAIEHAGLGGDVVFLSLGRGPLFDALLEIYPTTKVLDGSVLSQIRTLRAQMKASRGRVLWHFNGPRLNVMGRLAAGGRRHSFTSTIHSHPRKDFVGSPWKTTLFTRFNLHCLQAAVGLFVGNRSFAELLPNQPAYYVPNAIEHRRDASQRATNRQLWRERLGLSDKTPLVGVVARFDRVKDIPTTVRAIAALQPQPGEPAVHLAIAGDGPDRARIVAETRSAGVVDRVHFTGFLDDVSSFYDAIDVHVTSSLSEGESSYVVLEAAVHDVVTVGTDIPGIRNLIHHGTTGLLFPPTEAAVLAENVRRVLYEPELADNLLQNFLASVLPRFSPSAMLTAYLEGYHAMGVQFDGGEGSCL